MTYIGDKLMASGFVLSGARVFVPELQADAVWSSFEKAREDADLIMISQPCARLIAERLSSYQGKTPVPPVLHLPEAGNQAVPARVTIGAAKTNLGLSQ